MSADQKRQQKRLVLDNGETVEIHTLPGQSIRENVTDAVQEAHDVAEKINKTMSGHGVESLLNALCHCMVMVVASVPVELRESACAGALYALKENIKPLLTPGSSTEH